MFVRFLCNWPPYKDGQAIEIPERIGADFVARCMAEVVSPADVREYERTVVAIDRAVARAVDKHFNEMPRGPGLKLRPPNSGSAAGKTAGRRVMTGAEWRASLGQKPKVAEILHAVRDMQIAMSHASLNDGQRTIDLTAATDTPIRRREYDFFGDGEMVYDEILDMSPGAVRLERMNNGAALLDSHNYYGGTQAMIGAIVPGSAKVRAGKLTASAKFSRSENGERAFQDAKDGILRSVSVGYLIHKLEIDDTVDPPVHRIIDWEPHEVSAVAIPADKNAGFRDAQIALAS
jgi:hypothetical protein